MKSETNPSFIDGYPFEVTHLSDELKNEIKKATAPNGKYCDLVDNVREHFNSNGKKPDDIMLLLSWALFQSVQEGIHIDDLVEDSTEARTLLTQYMENNKVDIDDYIYDFEDELEELIIRAKEFNDL